jgi:hypothetical protein
MLFHEKKFERTQCLGGGKNHTLFTYQLFLIAEFKHMARSLKNLFASFSSVRTAQTTAY